MNPTNADLENCKHGFISISCDKCKPAHTPTQWMVKCDQCRVTIKFTANLQESNEGGTCSVCWIKMLEMAGRA